MLAQRVSEISLMNLDRTARQGGFGSTVHLKMRRARPSLSTGDAEMRSLITADFDRFADRPRPGQQGRRDEVNVQAPNGSRRFEVVKLITVHDEDGASA